MNTKLSEMQGVCRLLSAIAFILCGLLMPEVVMAKLAVKKTDPTISRYSGLGSKDVWDLFCDGYKTWITVDEDGQTQVYVNDDGGDYSKDEKYRVELPEKVTWDRVNIYGGKEGFGEEEMTNQRESVTCGQVNIKMDGGTVSDIIAGGHRYSYVSGNVNLTITGGTVYCIEYAGTVSGNVNIYLSNMRYTGSTKLTIPEDVKPRMTIFINNNCEFYAPSSRYVASDVTGFKGAVIPNADDFMQMEAYGAAVVPAGHAVDCNTFTVNGTLTMDGTVNIRQCNGWKYLNGTAPSYPNLTIKNHQHVKYIKKAATCTTARQWKSYCDVCGTTIYVMHTDEDDALGHNIVEDPAVAATCYSPGLSAGSHCSRCGHVEVAQTVIPKKEHTLQKTGLVLTQYQACFGGSITARVCETCGHVETSQAPTKDHEWVAVEMVKGLGSKLPEIPTLPSGITSTQFRALLAKNKPATCTESGVQTYFCKNCGFPKFETLPALNHPTLTHVDAVRATCTDHGYKEYWKCSKCSQKFLANNNNNTNKFYDLEDILVEASGHKYGSVLSKIKNAETLVSEATCTMPAIYNESCSVCGNINEDLFFNGEPALGHKHYIKSIDYISPNTPNEGILTIGCEHENCGKDWSAFQFSMMRTTGNNYTPGEPFDGYWVKSVPVEVLKQPTCVEGRATYEVSVFFHNQLMRKRYENFMHPIGYIHDYDEDGVCHHQHYQYNMGQYIYAPDDEEEEHPIGQKISKSGMGEISYKKDAEGNLIPDNTVYRAKAWCAVPHKQVYLQTGMGKLPVLDPEYGTNLAYNDHFFEYDDWYDITVLDQEQSNEAVCDAIATRLASVSEEDEKVYAGIYTDIMQPANTATLSLNDPKLTLVNNGHQFATLFDDNVAYTRATSFDASQLIYNRTSAESLVGKWQALMVPFSIKMTEDVLDKCDIAELYMIATKGATSGMIDDAKDLPNVAILTKYDLNEYTPASTPLFIRPKQAGTLTITQEDVELDPSNATRLVSCSTTKDDYLMLGVYDGSFVAPADDKIYYAPMDGLITRLNANGKLTHANRWYMKKSSKSSFSLSSESVRSLALMTYGEDEMNGIEVIEAVNTEGAVRTYSIDGREVSGNPLSQGFYVREGKKLLIK